MYSIATLQQQLETSGLAGNIYQHQYILVLQEPLNADGSAFNIFVQHDQTADQLGLQFAIEQQQQQLNLLIGVTHSNQDRSFEISPGNLTGDQKAFNLCYAFYNYPKQFFLMRTPLHQTTQQLDFAIQQQLFEQPSLNFLNSAIHNSANTPPQYWMKQHLRDLCHDMQQRLSHLLKNVP